MLSQQTGQHGANTDPNNNNTTLPSAAAVTDSDSDSDYDYDSDNSSYYDALDNSSGAGAGSDSDSELIDPSCYSGPAVIGFISNNPAAYDLEINPTPSNEEEKTASLSDADSNLSDNGSNHDPFLNNSDSEPTSSIGNPGNPSDLDLDNNNNFHNNPLYEYKNSNGSTPNICFRNPSVDLKKHATPTEPTTINTLTSNSDFEELTSYYNNPLYKPKNSNGSAPRTRFCNPSTGSNNSSRIANNNATLFAGAQNHIPNGNAPRPTEFDKRTNVHVEKFSSTIQRRNTF